MIKGHYCGLQGPSTLATRPTFLAFLLSTALCSPSLRASLLLFSRSTPASWALRCYYGCLNAVPPAFPGSPASLPTRPLSIAPLITMPFLTTHLKLVPSILPIPETSFIFLSSVVSCGYAMYFICLFIIFFCLFFFNCPTPDAQSRAWHRVGME